MTTHSTKLLPLLSTHFKCKSEKLSAHFRGNIEEFINKATSIHGTRYDYSDSVYISSSKHIEVFCGVHGTFKVSPNNHINGVGCKKCSSSALSLRFAQSTNEFLVKARAIHGNKYDYSFVVRRPRQKVSIVCSEHGVFIQHPAMHLFGNGCPECARNTLKGLRRLTWIERAAGQHCVLYFLCLFNKSESFYKVGVTYLGVERRCRELHKSGYSYEVLAQHTSPDAARIYDWEQSILETFAHLRYRPKQPFGGQTECFSSADEILAIFPLYPQPAPRSTKRGASFCYPFPRINHQIQNKHFDFGN